MQKLLYFESKIYFFLNVLFRVKVCAAIFFFMKYLLDPASAEVLGDKLGAGLGRLMGNSSIILEGNAQTVMKALNKGVSEEGWYDNIILNTRGILEDFHSGSISHVRREGTKRLISLLNMLFLGRVGGLLS
jgi:hypothetical protein